MRYGPEHKSRTHERIVKNASRQFRARGLGAPGVITVMKASGLTVGGFYKHFRSRDHLLGEALEESFHEFGEKVIGSAKSAPRGEGWKVIIDWYLSAEHCQHTATGCPVAALAPEIARSSPGLKKRVAAIMRASRNRMLEFMPGRTAAERENNFNVIFTAMAGALSIARIMPEAEERQRILSSVREHLLGSF